MGFLSAILGFNGVQSSSEQIGNITYVQIYHDGVDYEFEASNGRINLLSQSEGDTIPDCVAEAAAEESGY